MIFDYPLIRWVKDLGIQYNLVVIVFCVDWDWLCELESRFKYNLKRFLFLLKAKWILQKCRFHSIFFKEVVQILIRKL